MITHIAFTMYPVRDMKRARAFYERRLGLKTTVAGGRWREYHLANGAFAITTAVPHLRAASSIAFEVDDLDGFVARLRKARVKVLKDDIESPVCRMATVADPDGNVVVLHQKNG